MHPAKVGPYEVVRELGRGGMGIVLEARHPDLPRRLALKLISQELADAEGLERFAREARLLARVRHPNVVTIHAFARTDDGRPYLVTDLVEGASLRQVARAGRTDALRAARILHGLASAVEALHAQGILHRDLKPDNVILRPDDTPVLLDFGLARGRDLQRLTQTGAVVGTPAYMAPEQADGGGEASRVDARTDVYGLGAILFELLAARPPFEGGTIQLLTAVLEKEPRWPVDGVPPALGIVLRRAMAKAPAARYATAAALKEDLARFLSGQAPASPARARAVWVAPGSAALGLALLAAALLRLAPEGARAPAAPLVDAPAPSASSTGARAPTPSWDPEAPVDSYREHLRWLAENDAHPDRTAVAAVVDDLRRRETPLRSVPLEGVARDDVIVRFLSNSHLALLGRSRDGAPPAVHVLEVGGAQAPARLWVLPPELDRPWNLAVSPQAGVNGQRQVLISGVRAVHEARSGPGASDEVARVTLRLTEESQLQDVGLVAALAISPDGTRAVVAGDWSFAVLIDMTADPPRELRRFGALDQAVDVAAFSPDGEWILLGTEGARTASVAVFSADGAARGGHHVGVPIREIVFGPDGRLVVGTSGGGPLLQTSATLAPLELTPLAVTLEDRTAARSLAFGAGPAPGILYGACGPVLRLAGASDLRVWRLGGADPLEPVLVRSVRRGDRPAMSMAISPDGAILAIGCELDQQRVGVELWAAGDR